MFCSSESSGVILKILLVSSSFFLAAVRFLPSKGRMMKSKEPLFSIFWSARFQSSSCQTSTDAGKEEAEAVDQAVSWSTARPPSGKFQVFFTVDLFYFFSKVALGAFDISSPLEVHLKRRGCHFKCLLFYTSYKIETSDGEAWRTNRKWSWWGVEVSSLWSTDRVCASWQQTLKKPASWTLMDFPILQLSLQRSLSFPADGLWVSGEFNGRNITRIQI